MSSWTELPIENVWSEAAHKASQGAHAATTEAVLNPDHPYLHEDTTPHTARRFALQHAEGATEEYQAGHHDNAYQNHLNAEYYHSIVADHLATLATAADKSMHHGHAQQIRAAETLHRHAAMLNHDAALDIMGGG